MLVFRFFILKKLQSLKVYKKLTLKNDNYHLFGLFLPYLCHI